jgi:transcription elongation GreA/GreB family factor
MQPLTPLWDIYSERMERFKFLPDDYRAAELEMQDMVARLKKLGEERAEVMQQSTEIFGHDDACIESVVHAQNIMHRRIADLRRILKNSQIIPPSKSTTSVGIGSTVSLGTGLTVQVGSYYIPAGIQGRISYPSPLGRQLIGRGVGDEVRLPARATTIVKIS